MPDTELITDVHGSVCLAVRPLGRTDLGRSPSGHYIQLAQPELVIDATRAVVDAVRLGQTQLGPGQLVDTGSPT